MSGERLETGARVRLKHDPGRVGVVGSKTREFGGTRRWQVVFAEGTQYVPADQLEAVRDGGDDAIDLLQRGRLGHELDLRRTITHARLTGRLADVIYSMDTTGTDFYAHQFKPVVKLMNSAGRGLLIADEVGLGKTIEAGLIWTELRTRFDFRRLLVLCPAVLRDKWQRELRNRFGVEADILDATATLSRLRRAKEEVHTTNFAIIASLQGLRPEKGWIERDDDGQGGAASRLARFLDDRSQDDPLIDLCVIDEAHYLRNRETMTSALGRLVRAVSDYIVLLSATPIHLRSVDLHELVRHVDEDTFDRRQTFDEVLEANGPLVRARELVVAGTKEAGSQTDGQLEEELRRAYRHPLLQGSQQLRALIEDRVWEDDLHRPGAVARLAERLDRVNLLGHVVTRTRKRDVEERRVIRNVKKQVVPLSDVEAAFYESVTELVRDYCIQHDTHEGFLQVTPQRQMCSSMPAALRFWQQVGSDDDDTSGEDPDELERPLRAELAARARELGSLDELWQNDSKYQELRRQVRKALERNPKEKLVVFSYFRSTLHYLDERLQEDGVETMVLHGGMSNKDEIVSSFQNTRDANVLLSSEVGSEGIDLQFARIVINYDLPWNPMRVEQRIGRIDRLGQRAEQIHIWNLFYGNTIDERIHGRLFERLGVFEGALGALEPVLGDMIQELTHDLFTRHLTPEQEEARIRQTELALENRRLGEEALERDASQLTAYGDYILHQVRAARELHRTISAADIRSYVIDFFGTHYQGSEFRQSSVDTARFEVSLSIDARHDLATYIRNQRVEGSTRLVRDTVSWVRCRFENTAVPDVRGQEEVVSQFHPLVRFVASRLEESEEQRRPAVAIRLLGTRHLASGIAPGQYVFSVQRWSVHGLRDMERLYYAAASLGPERNVLEPRVAEQLIVTAAGYGIGWPEGRGAVDLDDAVSSVQERCVAPSEDAFNKYVGDLDAENADRADVQERMLNEHYETQRQRIDEVLRRYHERGQQRLIPATEGRLRALQVRTERRRREIAERRALQYSPPAVVCVGLIDVAPEVGQVASQ
ncbi:MAG: DEAD/DEAH box helicase [Acidobacteria bacterium]|nr:DEAD/DEAH box helicase [Acidobacteriota bacterium]